MTYFHDEPRPANLPSILRGIASDEEIRTPDDLKAINDAATEIEVLRQRCRDAETERDQLIRWQSEATEVLTRWDQVADLLPGSFLVLGARRSACVHAYIDHLRAEVDASHRVGPVIDR